MLTSIRCLAAAAALVAAAGCSRPHMETMPVAPSGYVTPQELAVYRTVAESVYVRATEHTVAIASTVMDSTCTTASCEPIGDRRLSARLPLPPTGSSPSLESSAELVMREASGIRLDGVALGRPRLVVIDAVDIPLASADTSTWRYFRGNYGGIAGVLRFSPVAFDPASRRALVSVLWRCGPACGHVLNVRLRSAGEGEWEILDMLLLRAASPATAESEH